MHTVPSPRRSVVIRETLTELYALATGAGVPCMCDYRHKNTETKQKLNPG